MDGNGIRQVEKSDSVLAGLTLPYYQCFFVRVCRPSEGAWGEAFMARDKEMSSFRLARIRKIREEIISSAI